MLLKSILLNVFYSCLLAFNVSAIESCGQTVSSLRLTIKNDNFLFSKLQKCTSLWGGIKKEKYYAFTSMTKTALDNCSYAKVQVGKVDESWVSIKNIQYPFFASVFEGICPSYDSNKYILLDRVKLEDTKETFFIALVKFIDLLGTSKVTIKSTTSAIGLFDNLLCNMCSDFEKELLNNMNKENSDKLIVEYVETDFTSKPGAPMYSLGIKWADQFWVVLLRFEKNKLIIKDVSSVQF